MIVAVPESLPQKLRVSAWAPLAWEQADPFAALRKVGKDKTILLLCVAVLLSYLPEVGRFYPDLFNLQQIDVCHVFEI